MHDNMGRLGAKAEDESETIKNAVKNLANIVAGVHTRISKFEKNNK